MLATEVAKIGMTGAMKIGMTGAMKIAPRSLAGGARRLQPIP
jgi:hypothetical protein